MELENSGSVARDHLASERTFLAYARTSLTVASTGVGELILCSPLSAIVSGAHLGPPPFPAALVQLFTLSATTTDESLERYARPLGASMIVFGLLTLAIGVGRYFLIQDALLRGVYPVARLSTSVLSFVALSIADQ